ncbi:hypothetical protein Tco_0900924 [Tanacetum coccineum]
MLTTRNPIIGGDPMLQMFHLLLLLSMKGCPDCPLREETYQVTLDALKLSPCYPSFLITAEVPEVYMHQFWNTIQKIKDTYAYQFKLDKKKFRVDTEVFYEILQIYPRHLNQDFVEPPSEDKLVPFIQEIGYSGKWDMLSAIHTDQMHQPWRTFAAIINRKDYKACKTYLDVATRKDTPKKVRKFKKVASPSRKLSLVMEEEPAVKPKQAKRPAKKSTTVPTSGDVIIDTPTLLEAAQLKKTLMKSKLETHKLHASGLNEGVGSQPKVPDDNKDDDDDDDVDSDAESDWEQVENGMWELYFVRTEYQLSDIFHPASRKIQLLDRKARYEKHVLGNV